MLTIRLSRVGKKNKPMYRLTIAEKARDTQARALEILGSYNPHTKQLSAQGERIKYWLSKGAQMSSTVNNLLIAKGIIKGEKVKAFKIREKKKSPQDKAAAPSAEEVKSAPADSSPEIKQAAEEQKPAENAEKETEDNESKTKSAPDQKTDNAQDEK